MFEKAKQFLLAEDRGVSPVIGVILMVAITVILAAVIATFVMNMGPSENTMPNAQFDFEDDGGDTILVHDGGEAVPKDEISISATSSSPSLNSAISDDFTASDKVAPDSGGFTSGETVTITWENPNSDETQILFEEEAP